MPRLICIDTYYKSFLEESWKFEAESTYEVELKRLLNFFFGTGDAYSRNLSELGWTVVDVIANCEQLQNKWARENGYPEDILAAQVSKFKPDVIFFQDLSYVKVAQLSKWKHDYVLAGQCSCSMPPESNVQLFDIVMTSFRSFIRRFEAIGVKGVYLPLAFEPDVLTRLGKCQPERDIDCAFVGGMGWQWSDSVPLLEKLAVEIPSMQFWGYGYESLPKGSPILQKYMGPAWGLDMYRLFSRSRIVVNRHGSVSGHCANNLRLFESCGSGALLLTEQKENLHEFFSSAEVVSYRNASEAISMVNYYLGHERERMEIAARGKLRTLRCHTYSSRMPVVSEALKECLKSLRNIEN